MTSLTALVATLVGLAGAALMVIGLGGLFLDQEGSNTHDRPNLSWICTTNETLKSQEYKMFGIPEGPVDDLAADQADAMFGVATSICGAVLVLAAAVLTVAPGWRARAQPAPTY